MGMGKNNNFKSNSIEYSTPQVLFDLLNDEFNFDIDACASVENFKVEKYWTKEDTALNKEWAGNVWMNPPFNRDLSKFVLKMHNEYLKHGGVKVCLIPVRGNTIWWNRVIADAEIRFINGEVNFNDEDRGLWQAMCILVFGNSKQGTHSTINYREMRKSK